MGISMGISVEQHSDIPFEICTIDGAFSEHEIESLALFVKREQNKNNTRTFTSSPFVNGKVLAPKLASILYSKFAHVLPPIFTDRNGKQWSFSQASRHVFYAVMVPGDMFGIHTDTGSEYDDVNSEYSKFTVLLYLGDDFNGGETSFFTDDYVSTAKIIPSKGRILAFDIDRFHKGETVVSGEKLWIGIEIVCQVEIRMMRV